MNDTIYRKLLFKINEEKKSFNKLVDVDNNLGLNVKIEEIINFLELTKGEKLLKGVVVGNVIITEGDIIGILKIIHDLINLEGEYTLYINDFNNAINTYLVSKANSIYEELGKNIKIKIDYSRNYNNYLNDLVTLVGSQSFINAVAVDFTNPNKIII